MIKAIEQADGTDLIIVMEDGTRWDLNDILSLEPEGDWEYQMSCHMMMAGDADDMREQGKALIAFSEIVREIQSIIPEDEQEFDSYDDDHEIMHDLNISSYGAMLIQEHIKQKHGV